MWRSWSARSTTPGRSGRSSCTPPSGSSWSGTTTARRASPAPRGPARPSWPCIGPFCLAKRHPSARILLTTFSSNLANALKVKLERLAGRDTDLRKRVRVEAITDIGLALYGAAFSAPRLATDTEIRALLAEAAAISGGRTFSRSFLYGEWTVVVDPWQIGTWEAYRDVPRLGRKTHIGGKQREQLWAIFERVIRSLAAANTLTWSGLFTRLAGHLQAGGERPFDFAVVDEAQDIGIAELRFLAALGTGHPASLFFTGDLGQRIFQQPFSWKSLGVDVRGRSRTLRINYRTSHQIRAQADKLLPQSIADVDGKSRTRAAVPSPSSTGLHPRSASSTTRGTRSTESVLGSASG